MSREIKIEVDDTEIKMFHTMVETAAEEWGFTKEDVIKGLTGNILRDLLCKIARITEAALTVEHKMKSDIVTGKQIGRAHV